MAKIVVLREDITITGTEYVRVLVEENFESVEVARGVVVVMMKEKQLPVGRYCVGEFKHCLVGKEEITVLDSEETVSPEPPAVPPPPPAPADAPEVLAGGVLNLDDHRSW